MEHVRVPLNPTVGPGMLRPPFHSFDRHWARTFDRRLFTYFARTALYHGTRILGLPPGAEVLVPAYHCTAAIEPFVASGTRVVFYRIGADLAPDLEDVARRITDRTRAVMCIHYFGFPCPIASFRGLCDGHGLSLIEDCAHVISGSVGGTPLGRFGDVSIFSVRKFFPTYDGAFLAINRGDLPIAVSLREPPLLHSLKIAKNLVEERLKSVRWGGRFLGRMLSRVRSFRRARDADDVPRRDGTPPAEPRDAPGSSLERSAVHLDLATADLRMSRFSRWVLAHQDVEDVVRRRRENYVRLVRELAGVPRVEVAYPDVPEDVAPLHCAVRIRGDREFHVDLRARGIPATTWGMVVHEGLDLERFPEAAELYARLIFLPVHQGLGAEDISLIARDVADVAAGDGRASERSA